MSENILTIDQVATLALRLPPIERVRLAKRILDAVEHDWADDLDRDSLIFAQAKTEAKEFITLDELVLDYEQATGHSLE